MSESAAGGRVEWYPRPHFALRATRGLSQIQESWMYFDSIEFWYPRQESNLYIRLRKPTVYPLAYGGKECQPMHERMNKYE